MGTPAEEGDEEVAEAADVPTEWDTTGVPGPPPVRRTGPTPRPRQQRGKKRK
jgi:hypothetical protein